MSTLKNVGIAIAVGVGVRGIIYVADPFDRRRPKDMTSEFADAVNAPDVKANSQRMGISLEAPKATRAANGAMSGSVIVNGKPMTFQQTGRVLAYRFADGSFSHSVENMPDGTQLMRNGEGVVCRGPKGERFMDLATCEFQGQSFRMSELTDGTR